MFSRGRSGSGFVFARAVLAIVILSWPWAAGGETILEIHNNSLTSYLPTSATRVQDIRLRYEQRGVGLDGAMAAPSAFGWALAGNPMADGWNAQRRLSGIDLATGAYAPTEIDISLPAPGFRWVIGRSYNARQWTGSADHVSDGYQGKNWCQLSQVEIRFYDDADNALDMLYIIYGADRYVEFKRTGSSSTIFKGKNGAAGVVEYVSGSPDTWVYYDQRGTKTTFFGGNTSSNKADWQIWKIEDAAGHVAYVGDAGTASTAVTNGYDSSGRILYAYDTADRRFTYTYSSVGGATRLTQVKAETKTGGTWSSPTGVSEVAKVDYGYYSSDSDTYGDNGGLKTVTTTTPLADSGVSSTRKQYFRYWEGTFDSSTNPGHPHSIKYVVDAEGYRAADWSDATFDDDPVTMSESSLKPYAAMYFSYDSGKRVYDTWASGSCGCSGGGGNGEYRLEYEGFNTAYQANTGYDTDPTSGNAVWAWRTKVRYPTDSGAYRVLYVDEVGQPLMSVMSDRNPTDTNACDFVTDGVRDGGGTVAERLTPESVESYTHGSLSMTMSPDNTGDSGAAYTQSVEFAGDLDGFQTAWLVSEGTGGSNTKERERTYATNSLSVGGVTVVRPFISAQKDFWGTGASDYDQTSMSYTYHASGAALMPKSMTTTLPSVLAAKNGSGSSSTVKSYLRKDGTTAFVEAADGVFTYTRYTNGQLVKRIEDAQTNHGSDFASGDDPNTDFGITETGSGTRWITTYTYDAQGRLDTTTLPSGRITKMYYSKLGDGRLVTISIPKVSGGTYYGPAAYTVTNLSGRVEATGTIALSGGTTSTALTGWISESDADPITALDVGTLERLTTEIYDSTGSRLAERRVYHTIPASGAGSAGTNYDKTTLGYDGLGRLVRTKGPAGTINRSVFDAVGRVTERWIGTNDAEEAGADDMVKAEAIVYNDISSTRGGNGLVASRTLYSDATTAQGTVSYTYDYRGRLILQSNPVAPHILNKYDNLGRLVATGQYSSTSGLGVTSDPTTTTAANRRALSETLYDERGRVYKAIRHKIDPSDGDKEDTLDSLTWYDPAGRVIKTRGESITKSRYDRLGRATHRWIIARDNDTADTYGHVYTSGQTDIGGDYVLEESQTAYDSTTGNAVMRALISRNTGDTTGTGALDSNADGDAMKYTAANLSGRIQITALWHDSLDRVTDSANYGTYNGATFDRTGLSVPARSDTVLVTSYSYNDDGTTKDGTDPRGLVSRTLYDQAGRRTATIANYVNGTPSSSTGDDDVYTRFTYSSGRMTKQWLDIDGDGTEDTDPPDQVTTYTYGVTKGASFPNSKISSNDLLYTVQYPESSGGSDVVTYAYNAQGRRVYEKDQAGNEIESVSDAGGRQTSRKVTTLASGFDGAVRRIETAYDSLGRVEKTTQYDAASSGNVTDEVKHTYDGWGNLVNFEQDKDSAVGTGTNDYEVGYTFEKVAWDSTRQGSNTLRRTNLRMYYGSTEITTAKVTWEYDASPSVNDGAGRVYRVKVGTSSPVTVATYSYQGPGRVIGITYDELNVKQDDPGLDRFDRPTLSRWYKDLSTDIELYNVAITYDRDSNITRVVDSVFPDYWSVVYTYDNLNRLTSADRGHWSGSAIDVRIEKEDWTTYSQSGNWNRHRLDLDGDSSYGGAGELDDTSAFNKANEILTRDTDTNSSVNYTQAHDAVGNLTDDGQNYKYEYDAFGRLRKVKNQSSTLRAEYRYNGLGHRIGWHYDVDADGTVEDSADDPWFYFAYDEAWRMVAMYQAAETSPKEVFVNHMAGPRGFGSSSKLDDVILRDRSTDRVYLCQNWRGDVVALVAPTAYRLKQMVRYSAFGVPYGLPQGDTNGDCAVDSSDQFEYPWVGDYDPHFDIDLDGDIDISDWSILDAANGTTWGRGVLSSDQNNGNPGLRKGYAGYEHDGVFTTTCHVRHRVLLTELGRWTRRDPLGYVDGMGLYAYVGNRAVASVDRFGLCAPNETEIWIGGFRHCFSMAPFLDEPTGNGGDPPGNDDDGGDEEPPCGADPRDIRTDQEWGQFNGDPPTHGNCYRFAIGKPIWENWMWIEADGTLHLPEAMKKIHNLNPGGDKPKEYRWNCENMKDEMGKDGLIPMPADGCPRCSYEIRPFIAPAGDDYHIHRREKNARWKDKRGYHSVRDLGPNPLQPPEGYPISCGSFCVPF